MNIVYIEDNDLVRETTIEFIKILVPDANVTVFTDMPKECICTEIPDLIIADNNLPSGSFYDRYMSEGMCNANMLLVTGDLFADIPEDNINVCKKPYTLSEFKNAVYKCLNS
jgi:hypothetical protein